jgi:hypothetical protein
VCASIGLPDAVQVIDPTLLLRAADYEALFEDEPVSGEFDGNFVLGYFVNLKKLQHAPWAAVESFAKAQGAALRVVPLQGAELVIPTTAVAVPTPIEWLRAFHNASCVVTNSFHGALFAVIMRRPFLVFLQTGAGEAENCRFFSALSPLGLESRIVPASTWVNWSANDLASTLNHPIDWQLVDSKLDTLRERSGNFLLDSLNGKKV